MRRKRPCGTDSAARMASAVLPMPPVSVDEHAPISALGREGIGNPLRFLFAPEEVLEAGEIVWDGSASAFAASRGFNFVMILGLAFIQREAFEDEGGG